MKAEEIEIKIRKHVKRFSYKFTDTPRIAILICGSVSRNDYVHDWSDVDLLTFVEDLSKYSGLIKSFEQDIINDGIVNISVKLLDFDFINRLQQLKFSQEMSHNLHLIQFGSAKVVDSLVQVGKDSKFICGNVSSFLVFEGQQLKNFYLSGIRDAFITWKKLKVSPLQDKITSRKLFAQIINTYRMILRLEGDKNCLSYGYLHSVSKIDPIVPGTDKFISGYLNLRNFYSNQKISHLHKLNSDFELFINLIRYCRIKYKVDL